MPWSPSTAPNIITTGAASSISFLAVIVEYRLPDCGQSNALCCVTEPRRRIDERAENDGAILTAKSRLHDETAELDLLSRILLPGFRL
jgi:hypothetical protein